MLDQSTIYAILTSPGVGANAIIRLTGEGAICITDKIFRSLKIEKLLAVRIITTSKQVVFKLK